MLARDVSKGPYIISCDLSSLLRGIRQRHSSNPMDKIWAIAFPFMKCNYAWDVDMTLPIYDSSTPTSVAWEKLISSLASTKMEFDELTLGMYLGDDNWDPELFKSLRLPYTATTQLLYLFPHPSKHHWFPSWTQVQQYPDVSVRDSDARDSDPSQTASGMDYSLRIMSGRIYRGCSLQLITPSTLETKAIYCSTLDGKDAQLVATVPGIELHIDPRIKYVLVDISPDVSLWPDNFSQRCPHLDEHEHLPIWPKSVIIVCEEVDTLALECPPAVMEYRLRRVTTLEWECIQPGGADGCWLPFKPSLEHMRSVVCSAKGCEFLDSLVSKDTDSSDDNEGRDNPDNEGTDISDNKGIDSRDNEGTDSRDNEGTDSSENEGTDNLDNKYIDLDVFCDPVVVASLLSQEPSRWPRYKVYLE